MTVVKNEVNELIPTRTVTGWRMCIDYRRLNDATRNDHFPLPFIYQMLEKVAGQGCYCFLGGVLWLQSNTHSPEDIKKDVKFAFNAECLRAFKLIKEKLVSAHICRAPFSREIGFDM
uniref:RNA-directed DNA polymerase homolog n=1 Tax=Nicotiana tabacum TaxID=4097 RepID=A0A1S3XK01_TOBAC|nr:PREDICTED: uncharacterized protein LOC107765807 [Nicotiana tabacum]